MNKLSQQFCCKQFHDKIDVIENKKNLELARTKKMLKPLRSWKAGIEAET